MNFKLLLFSIFIHSVIFYWLIANFFVVTPSVHAEKVVATYFSSDFSQIMHDKGIAKKFPPLKHLSSSYKVKSVATSNSASEMPAPLLLKILHDAIAAQQIYPNEAEELNETGKVKIGFWLHPNGTIENIQMLQSSGFPLIDQAALQAVAAISPVKNVDHFLQQTRFLAVDVIFQLA